jgi:hypothetical protein
LKNAWGWYLLEIGGRCNKSMGLPICGNSLEMIAGIAEIQMSGAVITMKMNDYNFDNPLLKR